MLFNSRRHRSRRAWNTALRSARKSIGPSSAATAAAWLTELGLVVLCPWMVPIALMSVAGPPA